MPHLADSEIVGCPAFLLSRAPRFATIGGAHGGTALQNQDTLSGMSVALNSCVLSGANELFRDRAAERAIGRPVVRKFASLRADSGMRRTRRRSPGIT